MHVGNRKSNRCCPPFVSKSSKRETSTYFAQPSQRARWEELDSTRHARKTFSNPSAATALRSTIYLTFKSALGLTNRSNMNCQATARAAHAVNHTIAHKNEHERGIPTAPSYDTFFISSLRQNIHQHDVIPIVSVFN